MMVFDNAAAQMDITRFVSSDLNDFLSMALALWPHHSREELAQEFQRILNSPKEIGFIGRKHGEAIGFVTMSLRDFVNGAKTSPAGYLEGIYVKEAHRKTGVARRLVEVGEKWVRDQGCTQIGSDTWDWNHGSILFHEHLGYTKIYTTVNFIKNIDPAKG